MTGVPTDIGKLAGELQREVGRLGRRLVTERPADAISPGALAVLGTLERQGCMSMGQLAEVERVRPSSMTSSVNALELYGLVSRRRPPGDRRMALAQITTLGRKQLAQGHRFGDDWLASQIATLGSDERAALRRAVPLLERLSTCDVD
jgi:DNA-binding MarR family transcriptional regulator